MYSYKKTIYKWCLYIVLAIVVLMIQEFAMPHVSFFGCMPILMGGLTATVAVFEGGIAGGLFGAFLGFAMNTSPSGGEQLLAFCYLAGGAATGTVCGYMFRKRLVTALLWSLIVNTFTSVAYFFIFMLIPQRAGIMALATTALPEIALSTLFVPLVYLPVREIARRGTEEII